MKRKTAAVCCSLLMVASAASACGADGPTESVGGATGSPGGFPTGDASLPAIGSSGANQGSGAVTNEAGPPTGGAMSGDGGASSDGGPSATMTGGDAGPESGSGAPPSHTPVDRIPVRVHMAQSALTNADLGPILSEVNSIWLSQAGICFEFEVTNDETNITSGFDVRYESGPIPGAPTANGLTQNEHLIWVKDHPMLGPAPMPAQSPTARSSGHELGHALNLAHENAPPNMDCATPCYCVTLGLNCQNFLMDSGSLGYFVSDPEVQIARKRAPQVALSDTTPLACDPPVYNR